MASPIRVQLITNHGNITLELNEEKAPKTTANFIRYVNNSHYKNTIFHRVIDGFMIQGGGFDEEMNQKQTEESIENEADNGLKNEVGTIAMARTNDPHSASAQFFINVADNGFLNHTGKTAEGWGYAVFGKVVEGMKVVRQIGQAETASKGFHQDVPVHAIVINEAKIIEETE